MTVVGDLHKNRCFFLKIHTSESPSTALNTCSTPKTKAPLKRSLNGAPLGSF
jgi:hypothetical protein